MKLIKLIKDTGHLKDGAIIIDTVMLIIKAHYFIRKTS